MNRRLSGRLVVVTALTVGTAIAACSSSNTTGPGLTSKQLVGSWGLDTISAAGQTITPPQATGTLVLTDKTYKVHVRILAPSPTDSIVTADSGTYTVSGSTFTQTSLQNPGQPNVVATASVRGNDTLDVKVTSPAQAAGTFVWVRQH